MAQYTEFNKAFEQLDEETKRGDPEVLQAKEALEKMLRR